MWKLILFQNLIKLLHKKKKIKQKIKKDVNMSTIYWVITVGACFFSIIFLLNLNDGKVRLKNFFVA